MRVNDKRFFVYNKTAGVNPAVLLGSYSRLVAVVSAKEPYDYDSGDDDNPCAAIVVL